MNNVEEYHGLYEQEPGSCGSVAPVSEFGTFVDWLRASENVQDLQALQCLLEWMRIFSEVPKTASLDEQVCCFQKYLCDRLEVLESQERFFQEERARYGVFLLGIKQLGLLDEIKEGSTEVVLAQVLARLNTRLIPPPASREGLWQRLVRIVGNVQKHLPHRLADSHI